jgi:iron(III) transport system substrate-binding protein
LKNQRLLKISLALAVSGLLLSGCAAQNETLTIYSGRDEGLIQPLIDQFVEETGIAVEVRYGSTAELAAQLLEEGANSPAHVYLAQDAGALGAVAKAGRFAVLPNELTSQVESIYSAADGRWVGLSGRARVLVYDPAKVTPPASVLELANPEWAGRIGIAPANASFQSFVTALRIVEGEQVARDWLAGMKRNAVIFERNSAIRDAVEAGTLDAGLTNHYYWYAMGRELGFENISSRLAYFTPGDVGNLINVAGAGVISGREGGAGIDTPAERFIEFMLSETGQRYFAEQTSEYPLASGVGLPSVLAELSGEFRLLPLAQIATPAIDLSDLDTLERTLELIRESGLL